MRTLLLLTFLTFLPAFSDEVVTPEVDAVNPVDFFNRITGQYRVDLAGGVKPHEGTDMGIAMIEDGAGLISFSYCQPNSICDPNDQYFPLNTVEISKSHFHGAITTYTIKLKEGDTTSYFTWDENGPLITLKNYQYKMLNGNVITLEHKFHRIIDGATSRIDPEGFFKMFSGQYKVLTAQGIVPEKETLGNITVDGTLGSITMPYCNGGCFLNEQEFPMEDTRVVETKVDGVATKFELLLKVGDDQLKYSIEKQGNDYLLKNHQFNQYGNIFVLEQLIQRID